MDLKTKKPKESSGREMLITNAQQGDSYVFRVIKLLILIIFLDTVLYKGKNALDSVRNVPVHNGLKYT